MGVAKNIVGQRFGRLVVLRRARSTPTREALWECRCDCGNTTTTRGSLMRQGRSTSCGCFGREQAAARAKEKFSLAPGEAALNDLLGRYKRQAKKRGIPFRLSKADFRELVTQDCHYCGESPNQVVQARYGRNGGVSYNGVDRVDNAKGYDEGNVVPCCGQCNRAKTNLTVAAFIEWASRVAARGSRTHA